MLTMLDGLMIAGFVLAVQGLAFLVGMWAIRKYPLDRL